MKAAQQGDAPGAAANGAAAKATPLDHVLARYFSNEELVSLSMTEFLHIVSQVAGPTELAHWNY